MTTRRDFLRERINNFIILLDIQGLEPGHDLIDPLIDMLPEKLPGLLKEMNNVVGRPGGNMGYVDIWNLSQRDEAATPGTIEARCLKVIQEALSVLVPPIGILARVEELITDDVYGWFLKKYPKEDTRERIIKYFDLFLWTLETDEL